MKLTPIPHFLLHRFILHAKKTAFIVEHDFIMATYLADRVIVYVYSALELCFLLIFRLSPF